MPPHAQPSFGGITPSHAATPQLSLFFPGNSNALFGNSGFPPQVPGQAQLQPDPLQLLAQHFQQHQFLQSLQMQTQAHTQAQTPAFPFGSMPPSPFVIPHHFLPHQQQQNVQLPPELQSFDFTNRSLIETLISIERHGQNNPTTLQLLEAIQSALPPANVTSPGPEPTVKVERSHRHPSPTVDDGSHSPRPATTSPRRKRKSYRLESPIDEDDRPPPSRKALKKMSSAPSLTASKRKSSTSTRASASTAGSIFTTGKRPLRIFVHFELRSREELVRNIKAHGGKIESNPTEADYCILFPRGASFQQYRRQAAGARRPMVTEAFITDSISQGRLEESSKYTISSATTKRRGKVKASSPLPRQNRTKDAVISPKRKGKTRRDDNSSTSESDGEPSAQRERIDGSMKEENVFNTLHQYSAQGGDADEVALQEKPRIANAQTDPIPPVEEPPSTPPTDDDTPPDDRKIDFEVAVRFLVENVSGQETDEDRVWAQLEEQAEPCKSYPSWKDFIADWSQEVVDEAVSRIQREHI